DDAGFHTGGQGVDHGNTNTVQTTGDRVGIGVELTAGVQLRHDDLHGRGAGRVHLHRDATAVVGNLDGAVLLQRDRDLLGVARHGLVHGVVHDLPDEVVEATLSRGADVHARALPDCLEALEDGDRRCVVVPRLVLVRSW